MSCLHAASSSSSSELGWVHGFETYSFDRDLVSGRRIVDLDQEAAPVAAACCRVTKQQGEGEEAATAELAWVSRGGVHAIAATGAPRLVSQSVGCRSFARRGDLVASTCGGGDLTVWKKQEILFQRPKFLPEEATLVDIIVSPGSTGELMLLLLELPTTDTEEHDDEDDEEDDGGGGDDDDAEGGGGPREAKKHLGVAVIDLEGASHWKPVPGLSFAKLVATGTAPKSFLVVTVDGAGELRTSKVGPEEAVLVERWSGKAPDFAHNICCFDEGEGLYYASEESPHVIVRECRPGGVSRRVAAAPAMAHAAAARADDKTLTAAVVLEGDVAHFAVASEKHGLTLYQASSNSTHGATLTLRLEEQPVHIAWLPGRQLAVLGPTKLVLYQLREPPAPSVQTTKQTEDAAVIRRKRAAIDALAQMSGDDW